MYHLWCYVKNIYLSSPFPSETQPTFNRLSAQNSNQSSSGLSILTRASGSFGTAGLAATVNGNTIVNSLEEKVEAPNTNGILNGDDLIEVPVISEMVSDKVINDFDFVFDEKQLTIENIDCVKDFR